MATKAKIQSLANILESLETVFEKAVRASFTATLKEFKATVASELSTLNKVGGAAAIAGYLGRAKIKQKGGECPVQMYLHRALKVKFGKVVPNYTIEVNSNDVDINLEVYVDGIPLDEIDQTAKVSIPKNIRVFIEKFDNTEEEEEETEAAPFVALRQTK